jgi:hypothetical protein
MKRLLALAAVAASAMPAQYTLSAMAGYIHHTEGEVWLGERAIAPKPEDFEHVLEGRRLRTGQGRAELMLVPGSFVRVGAESEIEMVSAGLTDATLRLLAGSLIVDLQTQFEKDAIGIKVGDKEVRFRKTGLYRIDAAAGRLRVIDGRARVEGASGEGFDVKSGQESPLEAGGPEKLAKGEGDALDEWNGERHEKLAVLAERARQERWDGMSQAERDLLRMVLDRPTNPPAANRPTSRMPDSRPRSSPR